MNISHTLLSGEFILKNDAVNLLIVENPKYFYQMLSDLLFQINENQDGFYVYDSAKEYSVEDNVEFIYNFFDLSCNSKKFEKIVNSEVLSFLKKNDFIKEFDKINNIFMKINQQIEDQLDYPITATSDFTFQDFIKFSHYVFQEETSLLSKIVAYLDVSLKFKDVKLVIFAGISSYLSQLEIENLLKQLSYMQVEVLLIENYEKYKFENCNKLILDEDGCVI